MAGGPSDILLHHAAITAELHSPKALNIVFDLVCAMKRLFRDLTRRFLFDQSLVTDNGFVCDRSAHVVDGAATRHGLAGSRSYSKMSRERGVMLL